MTEQEKPFELYQFGVRMTIFPNGDVWISTKGDIQVIDGRVISVNGFMITAIRMIRKPAKIPVCIKWLNEFDRWRRDPTRRRRK